MLDNFLDILIITILLISVLGGYFLGFIIFLIFTLSLLIGQPLVFKLLAGLFNSPFLNSFNYSPLLQILIFIGLLFILIKFSQFLLLRWGGVSLLSRILGGILGFLGGLFFNNFLINKLVLFPFFQDEINSSLLIPYVLQFYQYFF